MPVNKKQELIDKRDDVLNEMADINDNFNYLMNRFELLQVELAYIDNELREIYGRTPKRNKNGGNRVEECANTPTASP